MPFSLNDESHLIAHPESMGHSDLDMASLAESDDTLDSDANPDESSSMDSEEDPSSYSESDETSSMESDDDSRFEDIEYMPMCENPPKLTKDEQQLLKAVRKNRLDQVDKLLTKGTNVNCSDESSYTPLAIAAENNFSRICERLLSEPTIDTQIAVYESADNIGGGAIHIAAYRGYDEIIQLLIKHGGCGINTYEYCGYTPLHEAVMRGNLSTFKLLLAAGADPDLKTGPDNAGTERPVGLNTLGLIMSGFPTSIDQDRNETWINMLCHLLAHYNPMMPSTRHFREPDEKRLYDLIENILKKRDRNKADIRLKIYAYQGLHQSYLPNSDENDTSIDSDSESPTHYRYTDRLKRSSASLRAHLARTFPERGGVVIPHFRGEHFYPRYYKKKERHHHRKISDAQNTGELPRPSTYCTAAHELAQEPFTLPDLQNLASRAQRQTYTQTLSQREQKLNSTSRLVLSKLNAMAEQKDVEPLMTKPGSRRKTYPSRLAEFIQRYVNSYADLIKELKDSQTNDTSRLGAKKREKYALLKDLGFTQLPFVSTTEDPRWAFEYALSLVNYDKNGTHKPRGKVKPLHPFYLPSGHPIHPYLGVVHASLHTKEKLPSISARILDEFAQNHIDARCAAPGGHITGGYIRARERIFFHRVDADHIFISLVVRVPNFCHKYRDFMQEKYGLNKAQYNKFKSDLVRFGVLNREAKLMNPQQYFRVQQSIMEHVMQHQKTQLLNFLSSCVRDEGLELKMLGQQPADYLDPTIEMSAQEERDYIRGFVNERSAAKNREHNRDDETEPGCLPDLASEPELETDSLPRSLASERLPDNPDAKRSRPAPG
ncbi:MAG: hypothetical protein COV52_05210 [Gammaproteobacteria bacterium CG11_big_fil_rev_8_21_14_0_20_46_22]|nr:MAG: hypothetical protein COW05_10045 [Gammaproteobacteria bacterium CG12_big_fil_rev_8_21_14_0_65_46_12]PIR11195.1 MAG: hypothetical protein COV52_05210 [Gammaproteobacteria bacterium CG11_big_fil_rev_8_21_14_0_20_46_22]